MSEELTNLASRWRRLGGALIDGVVMVVIITPIMLISGVLQQTATGQAMSLGQQAAFGALGFGIFLAVNGYFLFKKGQTIGKMALKMRIVDLNENLPAFGKLIVMRYLVFGLIGQIPLIGGLAGLVNVCFIFGKDRRCLHDYLAGTRVINA